MDMIRKYINVYLDMSKIRIKPNTYLPVADYKNWHRIQICIYAYPTIIHIDNREKSITANTGTIPGRTNYHIAEWPVVSPEQMAGLRAFQVELGLGWTSTGP
jgi:hypothetical protein